MKKSKRPFKPIVFYVSFFVINLVNIFISTYSLINPSLTYQPTIWLYLLTIMGNMGTLLLFYLLSRLFKSDRARMNFLMIMSIPCSLISLTNMVFVDMFQTYISFFHIDSFLNPSQVTFLVNYASYIVTILIAPEHMIHWILYIVLWVIRMLSQNGERHTTTTRRKVILLIASLICIIVPLGIDSIDCLGTYNAYSENSVTGVARCGLLNYYMKDFVKYVTNSDAKITDKEEQIILDYLEEVKKDTQEDDITGETYSLTNSYTGIAKNYNVIFIQLESFNEELINLKMDGIEITPNLNKLVNNGIYFDNFYTTAGIGNTSEAEFSVLTGLECNGNQLCAFRYYDNNYETLPKVLKSQGYYTFSIHGNVQEFYWRGENHIQCFGFDKHLDKDYLLNRDNSATITNNWIDDDYLLDNLVDLIKEENTAGGNFFCYTILATSHTPYINCPGITDTFSFKSCSKFVGNYLNYAYHTDKEIGTFIKNMENAGLMDNTIICFYGDHGNFMSCSEFEQMTENSNLSAIDYQLESQKVPFIMYSPTLFSQEKISLVRSEVDVFATITNLLGVQRTYNFGTDMLNGHHTFAYMPSSVTMVGDGYTINGQDGKCTYTQEAITIDAKAQLEKLNLRKYENDLILESHYFKTEE